MKRSTNGSMTLIILTAILLSPGCNRNNDHAVIKPEPADDTITATLPGLIGGIYGSGNLRRLNTVKPVERISLKWDMSSGYGINWSAQWEGYLKAPVTGNLLLKASANREAIIIIGREKIIHLSDSVNTDSVLVKLHKDRLYYLNIKYFPAKEGNESSDATTFLELSWRYGKGKNTIIGESAIRHSEAQEARWLYIGEKSMVPFNPVDTTAYTLDPIRIVAPALASLDFSLPTGGLPVMKEIRTFMVCRADRENPEKADGLGYTYQHHPDMAVWHGRIYVGWNTCKADEDTWPSREVYSTSLNGRDWSKPAEMFPQGVSTPLRMYFYLSPGARMLMIAGLRTSQKSLSERNKSGIVVREIYADHSLGKVFTLRKPNEDVKGIPPLYLTSNDTGFVNACTDLLHDNIYLSQQDYGNLLDPERRMKWFDPMKWDGDDLLKDLASEFGKALCFYKRKDGITVGVSKRRWVILSPDDGKSWTQPVRPKSLITGNGKVWGQETPDGKYILVYNPDPVKRWPLVILTSTDGITFRKPQSINTDLPEIRYEGKSKDRGFSYHRGLSHWNNDLSIKDNAVWMVYSINKEDIVISRIPTGI